MQRGGSGGIEKRGGKNEQKIRSQNKEKAHKAEVQTERWRGSDG